MWTRALIVLLLVLNLGVAAWWALRPAPPPAPAPSPPLGSARLQLVGEGAGVSTAAPTSAPAAAPSDAIATETPATPAPVTAAPSRCYRYGPYRSADAAAAARARLQPLVERARASTESEGGDGWRVFVPPQASLVDAQALVQGIAQAGFDDFLIVRDGAEANSIALGRYRSEDTARRRAQALAAAGFEARVEPLGAATVRHWLDVAAGAAFDPARANAAAQAAPRDLDCAALP